MTDLRTVLQQAADFVPQSGNHERFAAWMVAAVAAYDAQQEHDGRFTVDACAIADSTNGTHRTLQHLWVRPDGTSASAEDRIVHAINATLDPAGRGKELVVFIEGLGTNWFATRVAERLRLPLQFDAVWVITLQPSRKGEYTYGISHLDLSAGHCPVWFITIPRKFDRWQVRQIN